MILEENKKLKAIVYTDGSCLSEDNSKIGHLYCGIHGYLYNECINIKNTA
ncbi:hypothetical protein ID1000_01970 [Helicobacter pylori]